MKRLFSVYLFLTMVLLLFYSIPVSAANASARLSSDEVRLIDKAVLVPVIISNNPGIMGFRVSAEYPVDKIEINNVTAGEVTANGSFIHNAGKVNGKVDVVWYSTGQVSSDGSLFVLSVKPKDGFAEGESTQISLSFSQADTFNEKYEDVFFDCQPINIILREQKTQEQETTQMTSTHETTQVTQTENQTPSQDDGRKSPITDEQLIEAVDVALDNLGLKSVDDIDSSTLVIVNENLKTICGSNAYQYNAVEELKNDYKSAVMNVYSKQAQINIEPKELAKFAGEVLSPLGADSFSSLSSDKKAVAVKNMYEKMHSADDSLPDISSVISDDQAADMFDSLVEESTSESKPNNKSNSEDKPFPIIFLIVILSVVIVGIACFIVLRKRKHGKDKINFIQ